MKLGLTGLQLNELWPSAFSRHDYSWNENHDTRMGVILIGGWGDDISFDGVHHIQRIFIDRIPPLDTARVSIVRSFPLPSESVSVLDVMGFVGSSGDFQSPYPISLECRLGPFEIDYLGRDEKEINLASHLDSGERREEKFDLVSGVWLADGRVFAENDEAVVPLLTLGAVVARRVHNGMWWKPLQNPERKNENKK